VGASSNVPVVIVEKKLRLSSMKCLGILRSASLRTTGFHRVIVVGVRRRVGRGLLTGREALQRAGLCSNRDFGLSEDC
jgi:hypothetical protein